MPAVAERRAGRREPRGHAVMIRVTVAFGTRPEAIKLAPVILELRRREGVHVSVVTTGQHRELLDQALRVFAIEPDVDLQIMSPLQSLADLSGRLLPAFDAAMAALAPDVVVVQGDTTSAFVCALAAFYRGVPVAHVEAGLRTADPRNPFPEEVNRRLTAVVASWHFAPTARARDHLLAEGVAIERVFVTGNTIVDALHHIRATDAFRRAAPPIVVPEGMKLLLVTLHRRESWGGTLDGMCRALRTIVERHADTHVAFPVHLNPTVRDSVAKLLSGVGRVSLLDPLDYLSFLSLMQNSWLVLTDSGGVQEEAPVLGKPVLILRQTTERPEAVECGAATLVGTEESAVVAAVDRLLSTPRARDRMARAVSPFGDGKASGRIADVLTR